MGIAPKQDGNRFNVLEILTICDFRKNDIEKYSQSHWAIEDGNKGEI